MNYKKLGNKPLTNGNYKADLKCDNEDEKDLNEVFNWEEIPVVVSVEDLAEVLRIFITPKGKPKATLIVEISRE